MPYISPEQIKELQKIDLLTYLQNYEPNELVHESGDNYCTRSHDSLKITLLKLKIIHLWKPYNCYLMTM